MPKQKGVLTRKQTRFVDEYLVDLNATQAAIRAGYSARNADKIGPRLVGKSRVAAAIKVGQEKLQRRLEITQERVLQEMARLAFFDVRKLFNENGSLKKPHELDSDTAAAIASLDLNEQKIKSFGKPEALRDLAKHLGLFEKDNAQRTDPVRELLALIDSGAKSRGSSIISNRSR
jgi:phage terminase small subunit